MSGGPRASRNRSGNRRRSLEEILEEARESGRGLILVTTRAGSEARVLSDLADAIFPHDPQAEVFETGFPGLLLIVTSSDPVSVASLLARRYPIRGVFTLRPLVEWELARDAESAIRRLVERAVERTGKCRKVRVRVRGGPGLPEEVEREVRLKLKGERDCELSVEILGSLVGVSVVIRPVWA